METGKNLPTWTIASEIELIYKSEVKTTERPQISSSNDAYKILDQVWDEEKIDLTEQFKVLLLNRANKVLAVYSVSTGGITGAVADPLLKFTAALKSIAVSVVLSP